MKIEDIFKQKLENREVDVKEDLWNKMESKINSSSNVSTQNTTPNKTLSNNIINTIKHFSTLTKVVIVATTASVIGLGTYFIANTKDNTNNSPINNTANNLYNNETKTTTYDTNIVNTNDGNYESKTTTRKTGKNSQMPSFVINDNESNYDNSVQNPINKPQITSTQNNVVVKQYSNKHNPQNINTNHPTLDTSRHNNNVIIKIQIPNVITPNGDGVNDCFKIKNIEDYPDNTLVIYNRQGKVMLRKEHYDNDFCGEHFLQGAYIYSLNIRINGKTKTFNGSLTVIY